MGLYDLSLYGKGEESWPPKKRKPRYLAYLKCLFAPLQTLVNDLFNTYRTDISGRIMYNSQTIVLEGVLNKVFGTVFRQPGNPTKSDIWIDNINNNISGVFIYKDGEGYIDVFATKNPDIPAAGDPLYLFNEEDFVTDYSFIVYVPLALYNTSLIQIKAEIEKYIIAGVNYNVLPY